MESDFVKVRRFAQDVGYTDWIPDDKHKFQSLYAAYRQIDKINEFIDKYKDKPAGAIGGAFTRRVIPDKLGLEKAIDIVYRRGSTKEEICNINDVENPGDFMYMLTSTTLGTVFQMHHIPTNECRNFTDYKSW